jgi:hypothetical protein
LDSRNDLKDISAGNLKGRVSMRNKKIIVAAAAATVCAVGITAAAVVVCKRLFEKTYFSVS